MNEKMLHLVSHAHVTLATIGLSNFWTTFQSNVKYIIFAGALWFAFTEWKNKAIGKMIMAIVVGGVLYVLTNNPETVLQPLGNKILEVLGLK